MRKTALKFYVRDAALFDVRPVARLGKLRRIKPGVMSHVRSKFMHNEARAATYLKHSRIAVEIWQRELNDVVFVLVSLYFGERLSGITADEAPGCNSVDGAFGHIIPERTHRIGVDRLRLKLVNVH